MTDVATPFNVFFFKNSPKMHWKRLSSPEDLSRCFSLSWSSFSKNFGMWLLNGAPFPPIYFSFKISAASADLGWRCLLPPGFDGRSGALLLPCSIHLRQKEGNSFDFLRRRVSLMTAKFWCPCDIYSITDTVPYLLLILKFCDGSRFDFLIVAMFSFPNFFYFCLNLQIIRFQSCAYEISNFPLLFWMISRSEFSIGYCAVIFEVTEMIEMFSKCISVRNLNKTLRGEKA